MKKILSLIVLLTHIGLLGCATTQEATTTVANTEEKKAIESNISDQINVVEKKSASRQVPIENLPSTSQVHEPGKSTQVPIENLPSTSPAPISLIVIKNANIRSKATTKSKIIMTAKKGTKVEYLGKSGNWLNIRLSTGVTGWIFWDLVTEGK
jgi:hypothetical protein